MDGSNIIDKGRTRHDGTFFQSHIICKFGLPITLTTNQGVVFTSRKRVEFASEVGIKLLKSTPYYALENGQIEVANKIIISLTIKKYGPKT